MSVARPLPAATVPLLQVEQLCVDFRVKRGLFRPAQIVHAVQEVSFTIGAGETYGLVGESGSGKSTIGRAILRLVPATSGRILLDGADASGSKDVPLAFRRDVQVVFQDPNSSLNPRQLVETTLAQALARHAPHLDAAQRRGQILQLLDSVGLAQSYASRYPYELSGGQRQRVAIARALAVRPRLIVCDEAVSALDVSTQAQVINLLQDLQARHGLSYLFISHNLDIVRHVSHRVGVLHRGRIVEEGDAAQVHDAPRHAYTRMLMASTLVAVPSVQAARSRARRETNAALAKEKTWTTA